MTTDYPVTRLQAAKWLRLGEQLKIEVEASKTVQVMVRFDHGPGRFVCRMWSGGSVWWFKLSRKQTLSFIRRNYVRSYYDLGTTI